LDEASGAGGGPPTQKHGGAIPVIGPGGDPVPVTITDEAVPIKLAEGASLDVSLKGPLPLPIEGSVAVTNFPSGGGGPGLLPGILPDIIPGGGGGGPAVPGLTPGEFDRRWGDWGTRSVDGYDFTFPGGMYATGGKIGLGASGIVGERGPELVVPMANGARVIPAGRTASASSGGGGGTTVNITIQTPDVDGFRRSRGQIASDLAAAVDRGRRGL
jgi:hypothetical protein